MDVELAFVDGQRCVRFFDVPGDPNGPVAQRNELRAMDLRARYPVCQGSRPAPAAAPSPGELAERHLVDRLQAPGARIEPGRAIVGLPAYLEITGPQRQAFQHGAFGVTIDIDVVSTYEVDWGDGTVDTGITSQGGPYPDGDVRHTYQRSGTYDIVVVQHWTATWRAGGAAAGDGTITGLRTESVLADFPVRQVQAVRNR